MVSGRGGSTVGLADRGAERVARVYATLSMAYDAMVRIRQRVPLFEQVCRVLVERGQLRMAWVGEVDDHGWIVPVAHAGVTDGYLDDLRISVHDVPEGRGPTGTAARERQHMIITDIATDERMAPWREAALARGYRSSAGFPLVLDDRCVAVLTVYASEPGFFDEQQVEFFDRMAADLSFASEAMERDERRRAAEADLQSAEERFREAEAERQSSEERFRATAGSLLDSFTIVSPVRDPGGEIIDFRHEYINDAYCALVGFDRERLLRHRLGELFPQFPGGNRFAVYRRVAETGEPCRTDAVQGEGAWAGTRLSTRVIDTVIAPLGENLVVSARDVTDRKEAEQESRLRGELLELAHDAVIVRDPVESRVRFWNREAETIYGYSRAEAIGRVTHELLETVFPDSQETVDEALAREGQWEGELRHTRKDGRMIVVSSRQALARDEDGVPLAIIALNSDITERQWAEEELVETTGLLERTQQISKTGGWEYDLATGKLTWTDEVYRIYGSERRYGPVELERAISVFDAESAPIIDAALERLVADGEPSDLEVGLIRADGERIWVRVVGEAVIEGGRVVRVRGIIADVTDRRLAEEEIRTLNAELEQRVAARTDELERANRELRENQATLEAALSSMTDAVFISDAEGHFILFNEAFTTFHRFTSREQTLRSLEDYPAILEVFMASGELASLDQWAVPRALRGEVGTSVEYGLRRRDTGERWVGSYSFAPIRAADGTIVGSVVVGRDITEWKNAQAELEHAQRLARLGSWTWDPDANRVTWSAQMYELFGRDPVLGPAVGDALLPYIHPEDRRKVTERYELGARSEPEFELEFRIITEQGEERVLHAVGREDPSRPGHFLGTFQDVTEQRRAEHERVELLQATARAQESRRLNAELEQRVAARTAELERANRELETFAYSVSHDLRAPLRAVNAFSQLLLDDYRDKVGEEGRHYLERVRAGAARMGDLIDAVLELSRLSRRHLARMPVDLSALASEIVADLQSAQPDRRVEIEIQDGLRAEADLALVRSVLQNLFANAFKFTSSTPNPSVRFGAIEDSGVPVYFVADNGAGFDMAHTKGLFLPFHRLHRDSEFPGEGIGLATVVRAIHRHGGVIWAHAALHEGATFHFSLTPGAHPPADAATGEDVIPGWRPPDGQDDR